jgi:hypothetical protein
MTKKKKRQRPADGEEGILLFEALTGRVFFRQYDKTKDPWGIKDYYLTHPDMTVKIKDKSAVFSKGTIDGEEIDVLDIDLAGPRRYMRATPNERAIPWIGHGGKHEDS